MYNLYEIILLYVLLDIVHIHLISMYSFYKSVKSLLKTTWKVYSDMFLN